MRSRAVAIGDVVLGVLEAGAGGRPLLLVHGFGGAKEDFADHLDAFAAHGWHAVAPDLAGHGDSSKPEGQQSYSLAGFAADVGALAEALGWGRFALLGHSMGGMVAQVFALAAPHRLDRLILMDTGHGAVEGIDPELVALGKSVVKDGGMALLVEVQRQYDKVLDTPAGELLRQHRPGHREYGDRKALSLAPAMWLAMVDELLDHQDRLDALSHVAVPTLVIVGEQDTPFRGPSDRMAATIPNATLHVIPDAGHSPQFENPQAWQDGVLAFLPPLAAEDA